MEGGGGTRMGNRSSTRHGPASVFSGPVRRWKKAWAPINSSNPSPLASRVLLYKWTPLAPPGAGAKDDNTEELSMRPVRYLPVSEVLAQRKAAARKAAEEEEAATQAKFAYQESLNAGEDVATQTLPPNPMNSGDVKEPATGGVPAAMESDREQTLGYDMEGQPANTSPILEKSEPVVIDGTKNSATKSVDSETQDQLPDEVQAGCLSMVEDEEMLPDSNAELKLTRASS